MSMRTIEFAAHTAHLDAMTGSGFLVLPIPDHDLSLEGGLAPSLYEADWDAVISRLFQLGWEPTEGEDGGLSYDGTTMDGRQVVGLYGRDPIITSPSLEECIAAFAELSQLVGLLKG